MARPVWRDVLERVQLATVELAETLAAGDAEARRTQRLWGRIAAKEAVRRIWLGQGGRPRFPADLVVTVDAEGRPRLGDLARPDLAEIPPISIAHAEGVSAALASRDPHARPGIDVVAVGEQSDDATASGFTPGERALLAKAARGDAAEWAARLAAARQAAARSIGIEPGGVEAQRIDFGSGAVMVRAPGRADRIVYTNRRKGHAWAWTLGAEA
jgi:hypothetical protein